MKDLNSAMQSRMEAVKEKYGQPVEYWIDLVRSWGPGKHMELLKRLREETGMTQGYATMIVHLALENTSFSMSEDELDASIYKGKEHWRPMVEALCTAIKGLDHDIEIVPKKKYFSLRTSKQIGTLTPATKTRFEVQVNLKGDEPNEDLKAMRPGGMCTHAVHLSEGDSIDIAISYIEKAAQRAAGV